MFTGIVDHFGTIKAIKTSQDKTLTLVIQHNFKELTLGESIAVNGICLTVNDIDNQAKTFDCDISPETLLKTNIQQLATADQVNLERSLSLQDRLGGHIVLGHVDSTAKILKIAPANEFTLMEIGNFNTHEMPLLVPKGSVSINGISLTINKVLSTSFEIMLIPHTLKRTNLQHLKTNDVVNIEFDYFARLVQNQIRAYLAMEKSS
ncbi:MAG: riboflavin synthase [Pseudomonadota bacterium]